MKRNRDNSTTTEKASSKKTTSTIDRHSAYSIATIALLLTALLPMLPSLGTSTAFAASPNLTVVTNDQNGNSLSGYYVEVRQGGSVVNTGFSPLSLTLSAGTYDVSVGDYGGYYFNKWSDGTTTRVHSVTIATTGSVTLTAIYSTSQQQSSTTTTTSSTITVSSQYVGGAALGGMYVTLQQNGATIDTGFTTKAFAVTPGQQYTVTPSDYTNAYFNKWSDGTTTRQKTITATSTGISVTALYTTSPQSSTTTTTTTSGPNLSISTSDSNGNAISGYYVEVKQGGSVVKTGFSPASYTLAAGTYDVSVGDYGAYYFNKWSDGTTTRTHSVTIGSTGSVALTAIYSTTQQQSTTGGTTTTTSGGAPNTVTVTSTDLNGNPLTGFYVNVRLNGNIVKDGFTPVTFTLDPNNQYVIVMYWCCDYEFRHFSDGTLTRYHYVTPDATKGIALQAQYELVPSSQAAKLNVIAVDSNGNVIGGTTGSAETGTLTAQPGMWMWITPPAASSPYSGAYTGSSSTPFRVFNGKTYTITMSSYGQYVFDHWQDNNNTNPTRAFALSGDSVNNVAVYKIVATAASTSIAASPPYQWYDVDH